MAALFHPFKFTVDLFIVEKALLSIQRSKWHKQVGKRWDLCHRHCCNSRFL